MCGRFFGPAPLSEPHNFLSDLMELEAAMEEWMVATTTQREFDRRIPAIEQQYSQFFKRRSYFVFIFPKASFVRFY